MLCSIFAQVLDPFRLTNHQALDEASSALMRTAMRQLNLSARAYHRTLKLALTITDLSGSEAIKPQHIAEALQYRPKNLSG